MKILGVDPGMSGAIAYYDGSELLLWDMPVFKKEKGGCELDIHALCLIFKEARADHLCLEKTTSMPGLSGKSAYSMGKSEGAILGIACSLLMPYTLVRPKEWKRDLCCPADKNLARKRASELLPEFAHNWDLKKHDGRAEAALIAYWKFMGQKQA